MNELFLFPPRFYVKAPTLVNYFMLTQQVNNLWVPFTRYLFNSVFVTVVATLGQVFICSMAAYVLSKGTIKGLRRTLYPCRHHAAVHRRCNLHRAVYDYELDEHT